MNKTITVKGIGKASASPDYVMRRLLRYLQMPLMWRISSFRKNLWRAWCINLRGNDRKQVTFASLIS